MDNFGELKRVEMSHFGMVFAILDVWTKDGIVPDVRLNVVHLRAHG